MPSFEKFLATLQVFSDILQIFLKNKKIMLNCFQIFLSLLPKQIIFSAVEMSAKFTSLRTLCLHELILLCAHFRISS